MCGKKKSEEKMERQFSKAGTFSLVEGENQILFNQHFTFPFLFNQPNPI